MLSGFPNDIPVNSAILFYVDGLVLPIISDPVDPTQSNFPI